LVPDGPIGRGMGSRQDEETNSFGVSEGWGRGGSPKDDRNLILGQKLVLGYYRKVRYEGIPILSVWLK